MTQADSVLSTPPTNTSAIDHPMMFPPRDSTRRRFLTIAAVGSVVGTSSLAAAAMAPNVPQATPTAVPSPALRAAIRALDLAHADLIKAKAANTAAWDLSERWELDNPAPESKRGKKRWIRKARAYQLSVTPKPWQALMKAESDFDAAQIAVAMVPAGSAADIHAMAACSIIYDEVDLARRNTAPIGRAVAFELVQLGMAVLLS